MPIREMSEKSALRLVTTRKAYGYVQSKVAQLSNLDTKTIMRAENPENDFIIESLQEIATGLGTTIEMFLVATDDEFNAFIAGIEKQKAPARKEEKNSQKQFHDVYAEMY